MPFDPTVPAPHADLTSQMFRDQFNGLKDIIDDLQAQNTALTARVAALEPPVAAGFGDPRANGPLTQDGMWNGYPAFRTPSNAYYHVADMDHYRCAPGGDPMNTMDVQYVNPVSGTVKGAYTLNLGGMPPAGMVS